jgi:hypothetical protein
LSEGLTTQPTEAPTTHDTTHTDSHHAALQH